MGKHGKSLALLQIRKRRLFFDKINPWIKPMPLQDISSAYHCLCHFMAYHVPLVNQDEVIKKAQDLHYEIKQQGR